MLLAFAACLHATLRYDVKWQRLRVLIDSIGRSELECELIRLSQRACSGGVAAAFEGFRQIQNQTKSVAVKQSEPTWINNESTFDNIPAEYVMEELEKQYNL